MNLLISLLYIVLLVIVYFVERKRTKGWDIDPLFVCVLFGAIYLLVPGMVIHLVLWLGDQNISTGVYFFDRVYRDLDYLTSLTVFVFTSLFFVGLYFTILNITPQKQTGEKKRRYEILAKDYVSLLIAVVLLLALVRFSINLGSGVDEILASLVLFRNNWDDPTKSAFDANMYSLTQAIAWYSCVMFVVYFVRKRYLLVSLFGAVMLFSTALQVSRRAILFIIIIVMLVYIHEKKRLPILVIVSVLPFAVFWIAYGEELFGMLAWNTSFEDVMGQYNGAAGQLLRAFSEVGISQVQSLATLLYIDLPPRLASDHFLSLFRFFPERTLGINIEWPERIVRYSTRIFIDSNSNDVPPGLMGQSWLDFRVFGAFIFGCFIGMQARALTYFQSIIVPSTFRAAFFSTMAIIIAMPINSGTYDFFFSVDIMAVVVLLLVSARFVAVK